MDVLDLTRDPRQWLTLCDVGNGIEMLPIIYFTFTRFSGLYFWSMIAADVGVLIYATGFST